MIPVKVFSQFYQFTLLFVIGLISSTQLSGAGLVLTNQERVSCGKTMTYAVQNSIRLSQFSNDLSQPDILNLTLKVTPIVKSRGNMLLYYELFEKGKKELKAGIYVEKLSSGKIHRLWRRQNLPDVSLNSVKPLVLLLQIIRNTVQTSPLYLVDEIDSIGHAETLYKWTSPSHLEKSYKTYSAMHDPHAIQTNIDESSYVFLFDSSGEIQSLKGNESKSYRLKSDGPVMMTTQSTMSLNRMKIEDEMNGYSCFLEIGSARRFLDLVAVGYELLPESKPAFSKSIIESVDDIKNKFKKIYGPLEVSEFSELRDQIGLAMAGSSEIEKVILTDFVNNLENENIVKTLSAVVIHAPASVRNRFFLEIIEKAKPSQRAVLALIQEAQFSELNVTEIYPALKSLYNSTSNEGIKIQILYTVSTLASRSQLDNLIREIGIWLIEEFRKKDATIDLQSGVIDALANLQDRNVLPFLSEVIQSNDETLRFKAISALASITKNSASEFLMDRFMDPKLSMSSKRSLVNYFETHPEIWDGPFCQKWLVNLQKTFADSFQGESKKMSEFCQNAAKI